MTIGAAAMTAVIVTTGFALSSFASQSNSVAEGVNNVYRAQTADSALIEPAFEHGGEGCPMAAGRAHGDGQCAGKKGSQAKGQNAGGNFIDANGDGVCDNMQ